MRNCASIRIFTYSCLIFFSFATLFSACSSRKPPRVFSERQLNDNNYFSLYKTQTPEIQAAMKKSSVDFFLRVKNPALQENLSTLFKSYGVLKDVSPEILKLWSEIIEIEVVGILKASGDSLNGYESGSCLGAYVEATLHPPAKTSGANFDDRFARASFESKEALRRYLGDACTHLGVQHATLLLTQKKERWLALLQENKIIKERFRHLAEQERGRSDAAYRMSFDSKVD